MLTARRLTAAVATGLALVGFYLAAAATATAMPVPAPHGGGFVPDSPPTTVVSNGSPWWVFVLVVLAASVFTLVASLAVARLRHTTVGFNTHEDLNASRQRT